MTTKDSKDIPCAHCGDRPAAYRFWATPTCPTCLDDQPIHLTRTPEEAVTYLEGLAAVGEACRSGDFDVVVRHLKQDTELFTSLAETVRSLAEGGALPPRSPGPLQEIHGDFILERRLDDIMIDSVQWTMSAYAGGNLNALLEFCREGVSVLELVERADTDRDAYEAFAEALLGCTLPLREAPAAAPWALCDLSPFHADPLRLRLGAVELTLVVAGLGRMAALSDQILRSVVMEGSFTEAERNWYLQLEPEGVRRLHRTWSFLSTLADGGLTAREHREEELLRFWAITPLPGRAWGYLLLLRESYVAGHFVASIILCRSVLERILDAALDRVFAGQAGGTPLNPPRPSDMVGKINFLAAREAPPRLRSRREADKIRIQGNKALHERVQVPSDELGRVALGAIRDTITIAIELSEDEGGG